MSIQDAEKDYQAGLKYKEIAEKYGVSLNTVKSWKTRHNWTKKVCTQKPKSVHTKRGAPKGSKNALGNKGGHAPPGNHNAMTHGLFAKYLPAETLEIAEELTGVSPVDILWGNICIKYAAILRAQKIMYVEDKADLVKEVKTDGLNATTYELQYAWDRQAAFMAAQARSMATLTSMLKQYEELCKAEMATEEQRLRLKKMQADITIMESKVSHS
ncbi:MAG: phage terminase small subunit, partial [Selenomonadaceae bacterium]